jgi:TonB-dependent starch-binding outer membrane protein SusC
MKQKQLPGKAKLLPALILSLLLSVAAMSQKNVTGKVTNAADNQPVSGATVTVKGTRTGTSTGADGAFSIAVPAGSNILVISNVGFEVIEVNVSNTSTVTAVTLMK